MESSVSSADTAICTECGQVFAITDMIRHKAVYVCAACKPVFMQKLAEGAHIETGELRWAGFCIRFAAFFVDGIILVPVSFAIQLMLGMSFAQIVGLEQRSFLMLLVVQVLYMATGIAYDVGMVGRFGATLGKMICGLKIVTPDGGRVTYLRALGRYFAKILSSLTLYIGYIIAAFDNQKRSLHDRICNTRVVYK
jgi:uncharacterized RDD family membrane protein YckC